MKEIVRESSTNGRWGLVVVGPEECDLRTPQEGRLKSLGSIEGRDTFQFDPEQGTGQWFLVGGSLEPVAGATEVYSVGLQSSREATIIAGGEFFAVRGYGYKGRSNWITCYQRGKKVKVSSQVLAAMGVLPCKPEPVEVEVPQLDSALAEALKAAGF